MDCKQVVFSLAFIFIHFSQSDGACTDFPTDLQSGTWHSSDMGDFTFNSTSFTASSVADFGQLTFTCVNSVGDRYFSLSDNFTFLNQPFKVAICFNLVNVSSYMYYYYPLTGILANTESSRITFQLASYSFSESETCAETTQNITNIRVLVRSGYINQTAQTCDNGILGQYSYVFADNSSSCNETYLDVCTNNTDPTFNYTACANTTLSTGGVFSCVYSETGYQIVYNQDDTTDDTTSYRFACWAFGEVGNDTHLTMYPKACLINQNYSSIGSPGIALQLTPNTTCPVYPTTATIAAASSSSESTFSAGAIVAVVLALILIVVAVLIMGILYYIKVHKGKKGKIQPSDGLIATKSPPLDTKEDQRNDGRVSPVSPYPTISEIAIYRFGPEAAEDDDGGMTLEATTPGFTDGRRTMYKDVERESQASIPIYSEVGGETPEPTRLSEVQTRMSEMSEPNMGDPGPWTMTRATMNIPEESTVSPIGTPTDNKPNGTVQSPRDNGTVGDVTL